MRTMETIPQAIPNMVRNARNLWAQRVRSTSRTRSRNVMPVCWTGAGGEGHPVNLSWLDTHSVRDLFREIWLAVEQIPPFGRNDKKKQILRFARNDKGSESGRRLRSSGLPGVEVFQG